MDADEFHTYLQTLALDPNRSARESLRSGTSTGPTVAFGALPSLDLALGS